MLQINSHSLQYLISQQFFDKATSNDLIKIQPMISEAHNDSDVNDDLISAQSKQQSDEIFLINKSLREPLVNVVNKLLGWQHLNFDQLTPSEQELWNRFEKNDIYKFLTGEKDTEPEFCHNWLTFSAKPKATVDFDRKKQKSAIPASPTNSMTSTTSWMLFLSTKWSPETNASST
jgi:hypothetical protein